MKKYILGLIICVLPFPAFADNLFLEAGVGVLKSRHSEAVFLRYQHDTSRLFHLPSYWEGVLTHWNNSSHAEALGLARGISWDGNENRHFSAAFGMVGISRTTEHSGTHFQFYFRIGYDIKIRERDYSVGLIHISNGKLIFGWEGPNSGENFVTLSVGLF
jgi:hypothetical protein